jgi:uncharacterized protein involved in response to NO
MYVPQHQCTAAAAAAGFFFQAEVTWSPGDRACTLVAALWCPAVIAGLPDAIAL